MRLKFAALLAGAFVFATVPAFAATVNLCAGQAANSNVGLSLTQGGITATGWMSSNHQIDLFCKDKGAGETGLGLVGTPEHEIGVGNFIQLDVSALSFTSSTLTIESVQATEGFNILGSNTSGTLGVTSLGSGTGGGTDSVTVNFTGFKFVDLTATAGNVLLGDITTPTPEPASYLLMGTGLLMLGFFARRKFASASL